MHPIVTIFCPFTRLWAVDDWLENLSNVVHDPSLTNLCFIVDGDERGIANRLKSFADQRDYRSFNIKINDQWRPNEGSLKIRRLRVAEVHNQSKELINQTDGDIVIGFEDDTVFDRLISFNQLVQPLVNDKDIGFVEGVQLGRWGANIVGAWTADNPDNPMQIETLLPGTGFEEITGGGFYGYATRRVLYLHHEYYTSTSQPWGPDVNYGFYVIHQGYRCFINWDVNFGHRDFNKILYADDENVRLAKVVFHKNILTGRWDRTDHEPSRY